MNELESRKQYLKTYRRQLRGELDAMGYGRSELRDPILRRDGRLSALSAWVVVTLTLMALGLISSQI